MREFCKRISFKLYIFLVTFLFFISIRDHPIFNAQKPTKNDNYRGKPLKRPEKIEKIEEIHDQIDEKATSPPQKPSNPDPNPNESRDPQTHCRPGQKYSDIHPSINQNWQLNLSREKLTAEEMHEKLIHRLSEEEKQDWICKIFGDRLTEQPNKDEEVSIAHFYQGGRGEEKQMKDKSFKEDDEKFGVKGYGYRMCGNCVFTKDRVNADVLVVDNGKGFNFA